jgi:hypothetical protein
MVAGTRSAPARINIAMDAAMHTPLPRWVIERRTRRDHFSAAALSITDDLLHRNILLLGAMCGRLRVGKENLHVASLVGATMCSACLCGSHDRWP